MELQDVATYKLPRTYDPDSNAIGIEVYLEPTASYPDKYPPFLTYDNATRTLTFKPDTIWVRGRTYYFTIVVKEKSSNAKTEYMATCKVLGKPTTDIKYYVRDLAQPDPLKPLQGKLFFDHSINTEWLVQADNLFEMFDIFFMRDCNNRLQRMNSTIFDII